VQACEQIARKREARKPASWDEAGSGAAPSPLLWNEPFGQGQPAVQVPAGLLANVHASGRERLEHRSHSRLLADIARSAVESPRSPNGDARPFPVALRGDPSHKDNSSGSAAHRYESRFPFLSDVECADERLHNGVFGPSFKSDHEQLLSMMRFVCECGIIPLS